MKKIRTLIIEDQAESSFVLTKKINDHCTELSILGQASNVKEALAMIELTLPDLIFLDIRLGHETGFDILDQISDINFQVIFVTAYDDYAIKAFQYNALHYLLKPIETNELFEAVNRVIQHHTSQTQFHTAINHFTQNKWEKIAIPSVSKITYVQIDQVLRIQADGAYSIFCLNNGKEMVSTKPIKFYEKLLSDNGFYRVHRSHLVALSHVTEYRKGHNDQLILSDESVIEVPKKKRTEILEAIQTL